MCENKIGELESLFYWIGSNHELRFNKKHFIGIGSFIQIEQHEICTQTIQSPLRFGEFTFHDSLLCEQSYVAASIPGHTTV